LSVGEGITLPPYLFKRVAEDVDPYDL
jgi:hypothetical protein